MSLAEDLYRRAFDVPREPRSPAYKLGVLEVLQSCVNDAKLRPRYPKGSAELDAWYAGASEGHDIWREWCAKAAKE